MKLACDYCGTVRPLSDLIQTATKDKLVCRDTCACDAAEEAARKAHLAELRRQSLWLTSRGPEMEPRVIEVSSRVRVEETSSDGEWLDTYTVVWEPAPGEDWIAVPLPEGAKLNHALAVGIAFAESLAPLALPT